MLIKQASCFLFCFYIKPQLDESYLALGTRCFLLCFYIKPQPRVVFLVIPNKLCQIYGKQKGLQVHEEVRLMRYFLSYQCKYSKNKVASKQKSQKSPLKKLQLLGCCQLCLLNLTPKILYFAKLFVRDTQNTC